MLTEREVRTAQAPGRAAELLADLRVPGVPAGAERGELLGVMAAARAVHWPDLVLVALTGRLVAVELTLKPRSALSTILQAYQQAGCAVVCVGTESVLRQLQGRPGPDGRWIDGVAQDIGLLPRGGHPARRGTSLGESVWPEGTRPLSGVLRALASPCVLGQHHLMVNYVPSPDEVAAARTPNGGWSRKQLAEWDVPWPPPTGWRKHLEAKWRGEDVGSVPREEPDQDALF